MWQAWTLQQETSRRASEIYEIDDLAEEVTGLRSTIYSWMFDSAVTWFGRYIEAKLSETDKNGKPKHTLEELLNPPGAAELVELMRRMGTHIKVKS